MIQVSINGYRVRSERSESLTRELVEGVFQQSLPNYLVHRDNRRTLSAQFQMHEERFVLKIPRARNARLWERVLSVFRGSDVARVYMGMHTLAQLGLVGARPVLVAERSVAGVTLDGFLIYEYLEGTPCTESSAELIAQAVLKLHDKGYKRRDIHLGNFLVTQNGLIGMIDFRISHPRFLSQLQLDLELVQMLQAIPLTHYYVPNDRLCSANFKAAQAVHEVQTHARKLRKKIKGLFTPYEPTR